jgi:hypothetical protein
MPGFCDSTIEDLTAETLVDCRRCGHSLAVHRGTVQECVLCHCVSFVGEDCRPPVETKTAKELGMVEASGDDEAVWCAVEDAGLTGKPKKK